MAKNRSEKACFQSKFGGGWITAPQFLAEIMCERFAQSQGDHLSERFWDDSYWLKKFTQQATQASVFLKEYDIDVILKALAHPDLKRVYSFGLKSAFEPILKRTKWKMEQAKPVVKQDTEIPEPVNTNEKPRQPFSRKGNMLNKLRELEDSDG